MELKQDRAEVHAEQKSALEEAQWYLVMLAALIVVDDHGEKRKRGGLELRDKNVGKESWSDFLEKASTQRHYKQLFCLSYNLMHIECVCNDGWSIQRPSSPSSGLLQRGRA